MSSSSDGLSVAGQGATASREESEKSAVHVSPHAVSHATSALHSNHLTVPSFVPDRHASTPGTSFLPGTFVFWVHDDEKVMDAMPGFSTTLFFRSHLDGVYTACRTINRWSIMDYEAHLKRLELITTLLPSKKIFDASPHSKLCVRNSAQVLNQPSDKSSSTHDSSTPLTDPHSQTPTTSPRSNNSETFSWCLNTETMKLVISPILKNMLTKFDQHDDCASGELRLTILVSHKLDEKGEWKGSSSPIELDFTKFDQVEGKDAEEKRRRGVFFELYEVWVFGEYLPEIPEPPIIVDIIEAERHNPTVKHVDWTSERKKLEREGNQNANEMLLMDHTGHIYEGLSSNFVVIMASNDSSAAGMKSPAGIEIPEVLKIGENSIGDAPISSMAEKTGDVPSEGSETSSDSLRDVRKERTICTAPNHTVLNGTIRSMMLQCAQEWKLNVLYECPTVQQLKSGKWLGCAVMSTSRLLLPISRINLLKERLLANPPPDTVDKGTSAAMAASVTQESGREVEARKPAEESTFLPTSSHYTDATYVFPSDEPILALLKQAIIKKMLQSSTNLKEAN